MAQKGENPQTSGKPADGAAADPVATGGSGLPPWSQLWQGPVFVAGLVCFAAAIVLIISEHRGPNLGAALDKASEYLKAGNYDGARTAMGAIRARMDSATQPVQARYSQLQGDLVFLDQQSHNWDVAANDKQVMAFYTQAQKLGLAPDKEHQARWAQALIGLDDYDGAMTLIGPLADASERVKLIRRLIDRRQTTGNLPPAVLADLLDRLSKDAGQETEAARRRAAMIWAAWARCNAMVESGSVPQAITHLQQDLVGFMADGKESDLRPLFVLLAKAYEKSGDYASAEPEYRRVSMMSNPDDPRDTEWSAQALVGLGRVTLARAGATPSPQDLQQALDYFAKAESEYRTSSVYLEALMGRADCEARMGQMGRAMDHLGQIVQRLVDTGQTGTPQVQKVVDLARQQSNLHYDRQEYDVALKFLKLLQPLFKDNWPPDLLLQMADATVKLADQKLTQAKAILEAGGGAAEAPAAAPPAKAPAAAPGMDPAEAAALAMARSPQAQANLLAQESGQLCDTAGDLYIRHAQTITPKDLKAYGGSLWNAALCYERALEWKKAIDVLALYDKSLPTDEHHLQDLLHLGNDDLQESEPQAAVDVFRRLITEYPGKEQIPALVPLARAHIALKQFDDAKRVLTGVVTDHPAIKPESMEYQQALTELGRLLYRQHEFEPAVERLTEAVDRYGDSPDGPTLKFMLADSYRQSADQLEGLIKQPQLPATKRQALSAERARRLEMAQSVFDKVVTDLSIRPAASLSDVEKLYLRNAYMYRADCAYDLGRYDQAIALYGMVANRYSATTGQPPQPVALMAMVQEVNAYCEQGKLQEARAVNQGAQELFKRIPPSAFDDPSLPMNRQLWADWLRFTSDFNLFSQKRAAAEPAAAAP